MAKETTRMADTVPGTPGASAPAAGDELSIPKHRFDEVNNEVRRLREEMAIKDRVYLEERQRSQAVARPAPEDQDLTPEETGLDPQVLKAVALVADRRVSRERKVFEQQIGALANRAEKAELLAARGPDKAKFLPEVERMQNEHWQRSGGTSFMPAALALDLILAREDKNAITAKDRRIAELEAQVAGKPAPVYETVPQPTRAGAPGPEGTRERAGGAPAATTRPPSPANANFGDLTLDEMEARLEQGFRAGQTA